MTELEKLQRRRQSWIDAQGPPWLVGDKSRIIKLLDEEIAKLEAEEKSHAEN